MTYRLTYADFCDGYRRLIAQSGSTSGAAADLQQQAALYFYRWFLRCFDQPVPDTAHLPRPRSCEPAEFNEESHWENVFKEKVRQLEKDGRRRKGPVGSLDDPDNRLPPELEPGQADPADLALSNVIVDGLVGDLRADFNTDKRFGPDVLDCVVETIREVYVGSPGDFEDLLRKNLKDRLSEVFDESPAGRQRLSRATRYGMAELQRLLPPRTSS